MFASLVFFLLCIVQLVAAKVGGAPPNVNYNSKAFTGFIIGGCVVIVLFVALSIHLRMAAESDRIVAVAKKAQGDLREQEALAARMSRASKASTR